MPWYVRKIENKWVVLDDKGKPYGTHPTRKDAERQMVALYASERKK